MTRALVEQRLAAALQRHRGLAADVRALSTELAPGRRQAWLTLADVLESGQTTAARRAARRHPELWLTLIACPDGDRCLDRLITTATAPDSNAAIRWGGRVYAVIITASLLAVLIFLARSVLPIFRELLEGFGVELPTVTRLIFTASNLVSDWRTILIVIASGLVCCGLGLFLVPNWSRQRPVFTAALGELLEGGLRTDEAVPLAGTLAGIARPERLSPAIRAACSAPREAAPRLLSALAANYGDRRRHRLHTMEWLLGPVAVVLLGLAVGFTTLVLFLPLLNLVGALS